MTDALHIATYNIHKGFSHFNRHMVVHELRDRLHALGADLIFLQEVVGSHERHANRYENWPGRPQYEFLAEPLGVDFVYGKNAVYDSGHHGNAILSRFPIVRWENQDISTHRFEQRGLLHCEIQVPGWKRRLHCVCVHLGLFARGRRKQLEALENRIRALVPPESPLIVAGDFNDWQGAANRVLVDRLKLREVFELTRGRSARSFPSTFPLFRLDRIYVRGFYVKNAHVHHGHPWSRISDHAALSATMIKA